MAIAIDRRPPERGERGFVAAPAGQCCCCCCCCLHSVGGVIGALSARPRPLTDAAIPASAIDGPMLEARHSATGLYWSIVAIMSGLLGGYFQLVEHKQVSTAEVALMLAIFFPAVQLAASVVAAVAIAMSKRLGKEIRLAHLGKITLRSVIGAVIGGAVMLPMLGAC